MTKNNQNKVKFIGTPTSVWSRKKKKKARACYGTSCIRGAIRLRSSLQQPQLCTGVDWAVPLLWTCWTATNAIIFHGSEIHNFNCRRFNNNLQNKTLEIRDVIVVFQDLDLKIVKTYRHLSNRGREREQRRRWKPGILVKDRRPVYRLLHFMFSVLIYFST